MARKKKGTYEQGYEAGYEDGRDEQPSGPSASQFSRMRQALAETEARRLLAETRAAAQQFTGLLLVGQDLWELPVITWHLEGHIASAVTPFGKPTAVLYPNWRDPSEWVRISELEVCRFENPWR
jgi:hypothetical protein